jgi:hypothetical protein
MNDIALDLTFQLLMISTLGRIEVLSLAITSETMSFEGIITLGAVPMTYVNEYLQDRGKRPATPWPLGRCLSKEVKYITSTGTDPMTSSRPTTHPSPR